MTVLQDALSSLGFARQEEQAALLENMFFEGLFEPEEIWNSLHRLHTVKEGQADESVQHAFHTLTVALKGAGAFLGDPARFRAESLLAADLGKGFSLEKMQDWITYSRQSSYGRTTGMERFQLEDDQRLENVKDRYMQNAQTMGMVDAVEPLGHAYDESWVQGASRLRIESRLNFLLEQQEKGINVGKIRMVTAGNRQAYAPLDGKGADTEERTAEGLNYLSGLAQRLDILPPEGVQHTPVFAKNANKQIGTSVVTTRPIMEADVARDILQTALARNESLQSGEIAQSEINGHNLRADTQTTSQEAAQALIERIKAGDFAGRAAEADGKKHIRILNVTDQPFIPRMDIQVQDMLDQELTKHPQLSEYKVTVETIGKGCDVSALNVVKSDSAALARQQHMHMCQSWDGQERTRDTESLLFNNEQMREMQPPAPPARVIGNLQKQPAYLCR